ncbi:MAG: hypothetical protein ACI915_004138 [Gammaproteobacteria bacterium]
MNAAVIELNDQEVRLEKDGAILVRSPGTAIVKGSTVEVGESANRQTRLNPRESYNRFWYQLSQAALRKPSRNARHHADLAFRHLQHIHETAGKPQRLVLAIPGGFTTEQLALLLGITEACGMTTVAIVDAAIAGAASCAAPGSYQHIEIQQHRTVITSLHVSTEVKRDRIEVLDGIGYQKLGQIAVEFLADKFLEQSRFDPLHRADTEQLLFNKLPSWLQALSSQAEIDVELRFRKSQFTAHITRADLIKVLQPCYDEIRKRLSGSDSCLIGSRLSAIPGFFESAGNWYRLDEQAVFSGCRELCSLEPEDVSGLRLTTQLPATTEPTIGLNIKTPENDARFPGVADGVPHVLYQHVAYDITAGPLYFSVHGQVTRSLDDKPNVKFSVQDGAIRATSENGISFLVNGTFANQGATLNVGDSLAFSGSGPTFILIHVLNIDA